MKIGRHSDLSNYTLEDLMIRLNEELAEVIQANVKMQRFGIHDRHPTYYKGKSNWEHFLEEYSQVLKIVDKLIELAPLPPIEEGNCTCVLDGEWVECKKCCNGKVKT
jgi:hypothetical protein